MDKGHILASLNHDVVLGKCSRDDLPVASVQRVTGREFAMQLILERACLLGMVPKIHELVTERIVIRLGHEVNLATAVRRTREIRPELPLRALAWTVPNCRGW